MKPLPQWPLWAGLFGVGLFISFLIGWSTGHHQGAGVYHGLSVEGAILEQQARMDSLYRELHQCRRELELFNRGDVPDPGA